MENIRKAVISLLMIMVVGIAFFPTYCSAQDDVMDQISLGKEDIQDPMKTSQENTTTTELTQQKMSLLDLIKKGGAVGYLIIVLSIVSLGLILDYLFTIRKSKIMPNKDITRLSQMIQNNDLKELDASNAINASFLSKMVTAGLRETNNGYQAMIKAMEDAGEALASRIARRTEHLNVIGNISPMLGLLGTVTGMLRCFNELAHTPGAIEPKQLAGGIFEALITTCLGLIVAIPSLYAYAFFRNRVDEYTAEAAQAAEQMVSPFKPNNIGQ
ncbi:MAG: MotA/TolQ/ExbB proton channel family protein [Desulfatitalea sp.]|nr:MotA/TolQ/ExbB proton channel family protein [Desulfatitalea sp.]